VIVIVDASRKMPPPDPPPPPPVRSAAPELLVAVGSAQISESLAKLTNRLD